MNRYEKDSLLAAGWTQRVSVISTPSAKLRINSGRNPSPATKNKLGCVSDESSNLMHSAFAACALRVEESANERHRKLRRAAAGPSRRISLP